MTYGGLVVAADEATPHLGGSIKAGDPFTWCPSVWDYMIARFGIQTAMDLGSGSGTTALYFHKKGIQTIAVDGFAQSVETSVFPAIQHDLTNGPVITKVDFVHCQEVAEHIEEAYLDNLLGSLMCGKIFLMTHALPGQMGYHHVNLQPPEYWISNLHSRGASFLEEDSRRIRALADRDGAPYMARSGLVFANSARI